MSGYRAAHYKVERHRGKPKFCLQCRTSDPSKRYEWANLTGDYEDPWDYVRLCVRCHRMKDGNHKNKPLAVNRSWHDYIRRMHQDGETQDSLAFRFKTSQVVISNIVRYKAGVK